MKNSSFAKVINNSFFGKIKLPAIFIIIIFLISYLVELDKVRSSMITDSRNIDNVISESFDHINTLGIYLGKQIVKNNRYNDLIYINWLLKDVMSSQGSVDSVLSWTMFSWGDKQNDLVVNTVSGINPTPESIAERGYVWRARYEKWKLQLGIPTYGIVSNNWIIPAGIGISNSRDEYVGIIIAGVNIKKLISRVENSIKSDNAFIVASKEIVNRDNNDNRVLLLSSNSPQNIKNHTAISAVVDDLKDWQPHSGSLRKAIKTGRFKYNYYKLVDKHSMVILVGFDRVEFWKNVICLAFTIAVAPLLFMLLVGKGKN